MSQKKVRKFLRTCETYNISNPSDLFMSGQENDHFELRWIDYFVRHPLSVEQLYY